MFYVEIHWVFGYIFKNIWNLSKLWQEFVFQSDIRLCVPSLTSILRDLGSEEKNNNQTFNSKCWAHIKLCHKLRH